MSNTHLLLDPQGMEVARYTKTHLFSVHIPDRNLHLREDSYVVPGLAIHPPTYTPAGNLSLGIVSFYATCHPKFRHSYSYCYCISLRMCSGNDLFKWSMLHGIGKKLTLSERDVVCVQKQFVVIVM